MNMCGKSQPFSFCSIIPSDILRNIAENGTDEQKDNAFQALTASSRIRGQRQVLNNIAMIAMTATGTKRRTVYDAKNLSTLPGVLVRGEGSAASSDKAVNEAYDGAGKTYDFFDKVFGRNSIDDRGLRLDSTVHFKSGFNNAFWNGQQMVYGDGDGVIFNRFTKSLDVIAHELGHGLTQYEADLNYQDQSGALNEHFSDVFGTLVLQYAKNQTVTSASWLIGEGIFAPGINGKALRSMKAPGTAYNDSTIGKDRQPAHMSKYVKTSDDNGGVHINSGIPNKAFYEFAKSLGGNSWNRAGRVWYTTLCNELSSNASFQDCANKTYKVAKDLYGASVATKAKAAWKAVGINVQPTGFAAGSSAGSARKESATKSPLPKDSPAGKRAAQR
jgi:Zn-dependent metalloprotease